MAEAYNSIDITSANVVAILTVQDLYPNGIKLEGFSSDTMISSDTMDIAEVRMGGDGHLASGYTPSTYSVTINLEANSPSRKQLQTIYEYMASNMCVPEISLTISLKSRGETFKYSKGVLQSATAMPGISRILEPTAWTFQFAKLESL